MFETKYIFIITLNKNACKNILESFPYFVGSNQWKKKNWGVDPRFSCASPLDSLFIW